MRGGDGVDAALSGALRFAGDVLASSTAGSTSRRADDRVVGGTTGRCLADPWHGRPPWIELAPPTARRDGRGRARRAPYALELEDFARGPRRERAPRLGRADAVGQARAIEALYRAASDGAAVTV